MLDYNSVVEFIKSQFPDKEFIPLHEPKFNGREREYVMDAIDSTFVSSVGAYVTRFEKMMANIAGTKYAVATVNGTSALHMALLVSGVKKNDLVISQALTFIATCNPVRYTGASPVFVDVDLDTMGMSPLALERWLQENCIIDVDPDTEKKGSFSKETGQRVAAVLPMHSFGHPCHIEQIKEICDKYHIPLIEDAAESLGSYYNGKHTGSFGKMGIFSFNGNKTVTCGGGGAIVTDDEEKANLAKHLTTQAKQPHIWEFNHDQIGYNYRMPNLNAALACAQLEQLEAFITNKRKLAGKYEKLFSDFSDIDFKKEPAGAKSNYWLNTIQLNNLEERNAFLQLSNEKGVMTRPAWTLMNKLPMFKHALHDGLKNSEFLAERLINIPSSVRP
jgi:aminotransferase in exopolysaccharide biosynthesis